MAKKKDFKIQGRIIDSAARNGIRGLLVEAWDKDGVVDDLVGSAVTDAEGRFVIEFGRSYFGELFFDREPDLYFKVFAGERLIKSTEDSVLWNVRGGDVPVEIVVDSPGASIPGEDGGGSDAEQEDDYVVSGTVVSPDRAGVRGLRVRVLDKNVGRDVSLAETATDARGMYSVTFAAARVRALGKEQPDLQAVVYAGDSLLAASEVRYNAQTRETLNVTLPANSRALPSEYETLLDALATHYKGPLDELEETNTRQDITYLANKSGWDARAVALAALAAQFSARTKGEEGAGGIEPAYFYALFRAGLPADEQVLYQTDAATLAAVWKKAAEQGVIPEAHDDDITKAVERFQALGVQSLLSGTALVGVSSIKEMLSVSRLDDAQQRRFAELYAAHRTDMTAFWAEAADAFGAETVGRLQVDGKLASLTINNAPLISALRTTALKDELSDPLQLAQAGFHRATRWESLLNEAVPVPKEIPGDTPEAKRENYAQYLAAQVRLSYPTAVVAEMVGSGDLSIDAPGQVHEFLTAHQGRFEIGAQPIEQYVRQHGVEAAPETLNQIKRLQRVYQITPGDVEMAGLLKRGIDSAYRVVQHDREAFVRTFAEDLGGAENAAAVYDRSMQVHNAVFNIAVGYLTARNGIAIGAQPSQAAESGSVPVAQVLQPAPKDSGSAAAPPSSPTQAVARFAAKSVAALGSPGAAANADDVIAYGTLESLFGEMDFCACEHCRSVLSPAAYLVDLLLFIEQPNPPSHQNPQTVLFERRPDLQHLPLTCENTNTALPYIDVVNETLEYFIANSVQPLSLDGYVGHDTDAKTSADLLASPQFVIDSAYDTLRVERFPAPLPFHQPLEGLRRYFDKFGVPLPLAMERLRKDDSLERGTAAYGWRDILMEELGLSRAEYEILTDSNAVSLSAMYGIPPTEPDVIGALSNAKKFTRHVGITYEEIVAILRTRFINPNGDLIPKLERLGVSVAMLDKLKADNNAATDAEFDALLPTGALTPDPAQYDNDIKGWVKDNSNHARIMGLITLTDTTGGADACNFDALEFRHAQPAAGKSNRLVAAEFVRLLRFIRLWKKLGWTIEQTDAAVCALYRVDMAPLVEGDTDAVVKLDAGFLTLLPRLGHLVRIMRALNLSPKRDLLPLLACFSDIGTYGEGALYRQMFLSPALLKQDAVYADNGYGEFLVDSSVKLKDHAESLRSAFKLTGDEYERIVAALGYDGSTQLTVPNISAIFRRGYLARKLRVSVSELLLLVQFTGLDPFAPPAQPAPALDRLIEMQQLISLVQDLKARSLTLSSALYLIWNEDLSGKSAPAAARVNEFARTLRGGFSTIESEFVVAADPTGEIARARMTLVYGAEATSLFFSLLDETFTTEAHYSHIGATLGPVLANAIQTAAGVFGDAPVSRVSYDDFRQRLTFTGILDEAKRDALKSVATDAGVVAEITATVPPAVLTTTLADFQTRFPEAIDHLYAANHQIIEPFFARYTELPQYHAAFLLSSDPPEAKRDALLANFLPDLVSRRKVQQALQAVSVAAQTDRAFAETLLNPSPVGGGLHASGDPVRPALDDLLALETPGLSVQFYDGSSVAGGAPLAPAIATDLVYAATSTNTLPPTSGPISGIWSGYIEAPEKGLYSFIIKAGANSAVTLMIGGQSLLLTQFDVTLTTATWRPAAPLELKAGTLYAFELTVENVAGALSVQWERAGSGRTAITPRALYPATVLEAARATYMRFLKAASLAKALRLTAAETARHTPPAASWLNALPVAGGAPNPAALLPHLRALLDYARIKADVSPGDESLLAAMQDPLAATAQADGPLYTLTRWDAASLDALLQHFGGIIADLSQLEMFRRVHDAFALLRRMGIPAGALIDAATNEPMPLVLRDLQSALRARYDEEGWRDVMRPINDSLRGLQRDALVAYILHRMRSDPATEHIDTADKLFEYFLMDVQMEPCMLTSRIRFALSSVQLFIERCMMNLEPNVAAAALNSKQWEWMNRYRVWEANRKVFLFPENWLESELRDDKTPIFKEIESELLQSDITEESAATALLNYLSKLEKVAKLEPCGIHHVDADPTKRTGEIDYVVARTAGAHREYFHRCLEYGYWTPWEQIKLDIEDNPAVPVVWHDRLLLFWLRILKQGAIDAAAPSTPAQTSPAPTRTVGELATESKDSKNTRMVVQAVLCWSEYYNGKWQPARTSEVDRPAELGKFPPTGAKAFDRSALRLSFLEEDAALRVNVSGSGNATFLLFNTHSLPMHDVPASAGPAHLIAAPVNPFIQGKWRGFSGGVGDFTLTYGNGLSILGSELTRKILKPTLPFKLVEPRHLLANVWDAPFFYEDWRHVFYVTTSEKAVLIQENFDYGIAAHPGLLQEATIQPTFSPAGTSVPTGQFITEDADIGRSVGSTGGVRFGGRLFGAAGSIADVRNGQPE